MEIWKKGCSTQQTTRTQSRVPELHTADRNPFSLVPFKRIALVDIRPTHQFANDTAKPLPCHAHLPDTMLHIIYPLSLTNIQALAVDLLNRPAEVQARTHKLKKVVPEPNSFFMDVKCPGCFQIT